MLFILTTKVEIADKKTNLLFEMSYKQHYTIMNKAKYYIHLDV